MTATAAIASSGNDIAACARGILAQQSRHIADNVPGVIADRGTRCVHNARVALRRTRCALKLFPAFVRNRACRDLRARLGRIQETLGRVRDYDVLLDALAGQCGRVAATANDAHAIETALRARRAQPLKELCAMFTAPAFRNTTGALAALARPDARRHGPGNVDAMVSRALDKALKRVCSWARTDDGGNVHAHLHLLRILVRRLRYVCEFFPAALSGRPGKAIALCTKLQDILGRHQDACTALGLLTAVADDLHGTPSALLVCGALIQLQRETIAAQHAAFGLFWPKFEKRMRRMRKTLAPMLDAS